MRILDGVVIATFAAAGLVSIGLTRWGTAPEPQVAAPAELVAEAAPAAAPEAAPVNEAAPKTEPAVVASATAATFRADRLDECIEYAIEFDRSTLDTDQLSPEGLHKLTEKVAGKLLEKDKGSTVEKLRLHRPCKEQFADRPLLATCVVHQPAKDRPGQTVHMTDHYYDIRTVGSGDDSYMKECLSIGGAWKASTDHTAVERARIAEKRRKLEKMIADSERTAAEYGN